MGAVGQRPPNRACATALRAMDAASAASSAWATPVPDQLFLIGSLMGGPGAYLALGTIGLPLALALVLQLLAPRGSREGLRTRLGDSGQGGLVILLSGLLVTSAVLIGLMAGRWLSLPFAIALVLVGLPSARPSGLRWLGLGLTMLPVLGLGGGILLGEVLAKMPDARPPVSADGLETATRVWADARAIIRDFPILGTGLGSFAAIYPFYKSRDEARTTALSSLLQWWVEAGSVGVALLVVAVLWCLYHVPGAVRRVGTADRALAFGLIGAAVGFSLFSVVHWTVELAAIAVAASALGGIWNRWLAGGTDLFVEPRVSQSLAGLQGGVIPRCRKQPACISRPATRTRSASSSSRVSRSGSAGRPIAKSVSLSPTWPRRSADFGAGGERGTWSRCVPPDRSGLMAVRSSNPALCRTTSPSAWASTG